MVSINIYRGHILRIVIGITVLVLLLVGGAEATTLTVNASGANYTRIQDAIDNANAGGTILVYSGTYYENVNVSKQLILRGIDNGGGKPVVDARGSGNTITLSAGKSTLEGFMATGSGSYWMDSGIFVISNDNLIRNNSASNNNNNGIFLSDSSNNTLSDNDALNNGRGIVLSYSSNNNMLNNNNALNNGQGIVLSDSSNNNILSDNNASNSYNGAGISLSWLSSNNTLNGNSAMNNGDGIILQGFSNNNTLTGNNASNNRNNGISLSSNNTLNGNNASNNSGIGIYLGGSGNILTNNTMRENRYNFYFSGGFDQIDNQIVDNQIDKTNLVDGRPIYYITNAINTIYDSSTNAGAFYCIFCINVTIKDMNLNNNGAGIFFWNTTSSRIQNVNISSNSIGIHLFYSSNNSLSDNNVSNNAASISLWGSSNNILSGNNASNSNGNGLYYFNGNGIYLDSSSNNNTLSGNNASNNLVSGISLSGSSNNNTLINNHVLNNLNYGIFLWHSSNMLINNIALNNSQGITLWDSSNNNLLSGNNASNNRGSGINLRGSSNNNTLIGNNASNNLNNGNGIYLDSSNNNTLSGNNALNNNGNGIYLYYSSNDMLSDNNASNNLNTGIYLFGPSNNILSSNSASNNNGNGIYLYYSSNNMLSSNIASNNNGNGISLDNSIYLSGSGSNILSSNNASNNNGSGIYLYYSSNNMLSANNASNNSGNGVYLYYSSNNNTLSGNTVSSSSFYGIYMESSGNNALTNNTMAGNKYNFGVIGFHDMDFNNNIDKSNTVDSKPILYIKNGADTVYDNSSNAGTVYCIWCNNITIKNLTLIKNEHGIFFWSTTNSTLESTNASNNIDGIYLSSSSNSNMLSNNNISNNNGDGIYLWSSSYNILSNNNASNNLNNSINLSGSSNNILSNNNASNNNGNGIYLSYSSNNNTLSNNSASNNNYGIYLSGSSSNTMNSNDASNNTYASIYLNSSSNNTLSNNNASNNIFYYGIYLSGSSNNMLSGNTANSNNNHGIYLNSSSNNNILIGNDASNNNFGIGVALSSNNMLSSNIALNNNAFGIYLDGSSGNTLNSNTANSNNMDGIFLGSSSGNTLNSNIVSNNFYGIELHSSGSNILSGNNASTNNYGIYLSSYSNNLIYNNNFNNTNNIGIINSINTWNITKTPGMNIADGPYLGGNFWAYPNGTGFSQICTDSDSDGICDSPYILDSNNTDYLPLTYKPASVLTSIVISPSTISLTVGGTQKLNATALDQYNNPVSGINISWTVSNSSVGSITPLFAITGMDGNASTTFTATAAGTTMINATNGSITGSVSVAGVEGGGGGGGGSASGGAITYPTNNSIFAYSEMIMLSGNANWGNPPYSYNWTSSVDGLIGSVSKILTFSLNPGVHVITLNTSDTYGAADSTSRTITVFPVNTSNVSGVNATGPMTWNVSNFPAFWQESGNNSEALAVTAISGERNIGMRDLYYNITRQLMPYKVYSVAGKTVDYGLDSNGNRVSNVSSGSYYAKIGWFGRPYVAIAGKANKLAKLVLEQNETSNKTLAVGEIWNMGYGWTLTANSIDAKASPKQVWLTLSKDGIKKDDKVIAQGDVYTYAEKNFAGETDVPLFVTYVNSVFAGATSDMVQLRYTWLVSGNPIVLNEGDNIGVLTAIETVDTGVKMSNLDYITLTQGSTINIADGLSFKVDNTSTLDYSPEMTIIGSTFPIWTPTPSNQIIELGSSFSYDVNATGLQTITYSVNDTTNFSINPSTGLITNNTALSSGIYWLNITATDASGGSISQVITVTVNHTIPPANNNNGGSSGSGGSSSGGGGGGGTSGENYSNIEIKEKYDLYIFKDKVTSYPFTNKSNPILFVNITGNISAGEINTAIEVLKNTSSLLKIQAPGIVYKNMNIWIGTSGFAVPKNIKGAVIRFRVENSWLDNNNLAASEVRMVRWDGNEWIQIETTPKENDSANTYFEAKTNRFSSFAVTGLKGEKVPFATPVIEITETPTKSTADATSTSVKTKGIPGFEVTMAITILSAVYIFRRKGW